MRMRSKIQAAFDQIRAEDALKERTKAFVHAKTQGRRQDRARRRAFALAMACLTVLLLGGGGYLSYAMPVAAIGVDVNPSIELAVNIFDRVVGVTGYNEDGVRRSWASKTCATWTPSRRCSAASPSPAVCKGE